jgi:excisionase family DNA binding protein
MDEHPPENIRADERAGLRVAEFARAYGVSSPTVRRLIRRGVIHVERLGRAQIITRAEQIRLGLIRGG